jgi:hypothetical protein
MRYLKRFNESNNLDDIEKIWKVDPYEFKDIVLSEMENMNINGELEMINFIFEHPYPDSNMEKKVIFTMEDNIKKGPWYDNMYSMIDSERYKMGIEIFINESDFNKLSEFHIEINKHLYRADIPYGCSCPNDKIGSLAIVDFTYTWGCKRFDNGE